MVHNQTSNPPPVMVLDDPSKTSFEYSEIRHRQHDDTKVVEDKPEIPVPCQGMLVVVIIITRCCGLVSSKFWCRCWPSI